MMVFELQAKLAALPPTSKVMLDVTTEHMEMFKFVEIAFADEITTALGEKLVLLSSQDMTPDDEED